MLGVSAARDRRELNAAIPGDFTKVRAWSLQASRPHFHRPRSAQADVGSGGFCNRAGQGLLSTLLDPGFDLKKVSGNAPVCQIEPAGEATLPLEFIDGCVAERDDLAEFPPADGVCLWGRGRGAP